jgi:DNA mismatch repair protein MutL
VHPAKWEVRFADPQRVHALVSATVRRAVEARGWLAQPGPGAAAPALSGAAQPETGRPGVLPVLARSSGTPRPAGTDWIFAAAPAAREADAAAPGAGPGPRFADLRCVGQLLGTYLVLEDKGGLLLVDQHAAHERVLYERMRRAWLEGGVERQALLAPACVELDEAARAALEAAGAGLASLGFEIESFGPGAVLVRAMPALLAGRDPAALVRSLADELHSGALEAGAPPAPAGGASVRLLEAADRLFASLACHAARRAGDVLAPGEQRALLDALDAIPWAPTCPHGRPVAVPIALAEIERRFGR